MTKFKVGDRVIGTDICDSTDLSGLHGTVIRIEPNTFLQYCVRWEDRGGFIWWTDANSMRLCPYVNTDKLLIKEVI